MELEQALGSILMEVLLQSILDNTKVDVNRAMGNIDGVIKKYIKETGNKDKCRIREFLLIFRIDNVH